MSQLRRLAEPIPDRYVGHNDKNMDAADHTVITQLLHLYVPGWSFEITEVLRSQVEPKKTSSGKEYPGGMFVTGCIGRLIATVDGVQVVIEEAGGVELAGMKDGDGERLKHSTSDALKRAAMRLGLGLHIWAQDNYFLHLALDKHAASRGGAGDANPAPPAQPGGQS